MINDPRGPLASRLRQRKFELLRRFQIPNDALPGSLSLSHLRCGKSTCHCAEGRGHEVWSLTFMVQGKNRSSTSPKPGSRRSGVGWRRDGSSRRLCARSWRPMPNCWCWREGKRRSRRKRRDERSVATSLVALCDAAPSTPELSAGSWRWTAATANSREAPALGPAARSSPTPIQLSCRRSAGALSGAQKSSYLGFFLRRCLGLFHERLDPDTTRQALLSVVRRAKRNKAFDNCRWIGLAIDGTGAGWRTKH